MQQDYWLPLALPVSFVSISASIAPQQLLETLNQGDRFVVLFFLAILAVFTLVAAAMNEAT
ncbi:hypothetical protein [Pseudanabaena sp. FACHB-2040]|uniref:hypothetical protein n=1 Tax=Pseudanabaena sp. FACHB-2040 TaxID=2692859 RepID=UPI001681DDD5|nr:hypothetical protein [Pseudanabaena sp. FACHB-2040]MBD2256149.1 hypothetical protein [Pseudanabaena sp. FACHB-2040]